MLRCVDGCWFADHGYGKQRNINAIINNSETTRMIHVHRYYLHALNMMTTMMILINFMSFITTRIQQGLRYLPQQAGKDKTIHDRWTRKTRYQCSLWFWREPSCLWKCKVEMNIAGNRRWPPSRQRQSWWWWSSHTTEEGLARFQHSHHSFINQINCGKNQRELKVKYIGNVYKE